MSDKGFEIGRRIISRSTNKQVKPKNQCSPPTTTPKKRTSKWYNEVKTWGINEAKWKSATQWCEDNNMKFQIITEDHLDIRYK